MSVVSYAVNLHRSRDLQSSSPIADGRRRFHLASDGSCALNKYPQLQQSDGMPVRKHTPKGTSAGRSLLGYPGKYDSCRSKPCTYVEKGDGGALGIG